MCGTQTASQSLLRAARRVYTKAASSRLAQAFGPRIANPRWRALRRALTFAHADIELAVAEERVVFRAVAQVDGARLLGRDRRAIRVDDVATRRADVGLVGQALGVGAAERLR